MLASYIRKFRLLFKRTFRSYRSSPLYISIFLFWWAKLKTYPQRNILRSLPCTILFHNKQGRIVSFTNAFKQLVSPVQNTHTSSTPLSVIQQKHMYQQRQAGMKYILSTQYTQTLQHLSFFHIKVALLLRSRRPLCFRFHHQIITGGLSTALTISCSPSFKQLYISAIGSLYHISPFALFASSA